MIRVNNRRIIRRLALRELKSNRKMCFIVVLSIVLTCILFTALTSIGGSLIHGMQQETMRQVGGKNHAGVKYVLQEDYEKIKADSATQDVSYRIIVGNLVNDELKNISAEVNCAENEEAAASMFCAPEVGRLPEAYDEIAMSTLVLDELGLPHELGITVPVKLDIDGEISGHEFTLCGYWQGDKVAMAQECWVSRAFANEQAPAPTVSFRSQEYMKYAGYYMVDFNFANSWDIEGKTNALKERIYGDTDDAPYVGINWAYTTSRVDGGMLAGGTILLFVVFMAGHLIIYNIFYINISANIRNYGLLKTIGTTARQIQKMVRTQATVYCLAGIPLGLIIGMLLGKPLLGAVMKTLDIRSTESYSISEGLAVMICLISATFTFLTVMMSCYEPCKIAGKVSPMEALRYNETDINKKKKSKKTGKISPFTVAGNNMSRAYRKTVVVVLSLSLGMVLVNMMFTVIRGIDEDKFIGNMIIGDILVRHSDNTNFWDERTKGITPDMIADLRQIDGTDVHPVYYDYGKVQPDGEPLERLKTLYDRYKDNEIVKGDLDAALNGELFADIYGIDMEAISYFEPVMGSIVPEKLMSGKYAIVHTYLYDADHDSDVEIYHPGDRITVENGEIRCEYEVMAVCEVPYPLSTKIYHMFSTQVVLPETEYMALADAPGACSVMINIEGDRERVKEQCKAYCAGEGSPLTYSDKQTFLDEFNSFINMIKLVGGILTGILTLIGILNFVNAVVTGIISRKKELAMMNAVGMTDSQLQEMLMWEGVCYVIFTAAASICIASLINHFVIRSIGKELFFYIYRFTLTPIAVCTPVLLCLSAVIPVVSYKMVCKESVVDRLRES